MHQALNVCVVQEYNSRIPSVHLSLSLSLVHLNLSLCLVHLNLGLCSLKPQFLYSSPQPKFMFKLNSVPCVIRWTWKYPGANVILVIEFYCKEWEPKLEFILALLMPRWCWLTKIGILVTLILWLGFCFVEFPPALAVVLFINKLKLMCPWIG